MREPVPPVDDVVRAEFDAPDLDAATLAEAAAYDKQETPTWAPSDPAARGRTFIQQHPDAQVEILFPTVYEEDRSTKITDLVTAQGVDVLSHGRVARQVAKELGFEQYDYAAEQEQIAREKKRRPVLTPTPDEDAIEGFHEDLARMNRALDRLAEVVRALPPPHRVVMPEGEV